MATVAEPGAAFTVVDAAAAPCCSGAVGAGLGSWSAAYPDVYALDFTRLRAAGHVHDRGRRARRGVVPAVPRSARGAAPLRGSRSPTRCSSTRTSATARTSSRRAAAHRARPPERRARDDVPDAEGRRRRQLHRRPAPARRARSTPSGGWWDAGDYLKFVETTSYTVDVLLAGVRDFPGRWARRGPRPDFTAEAAFGARLAAADVGRPHAHALLPGRHRRGERPDRSATTTSGGCRRPTTPTAAPTRAYRYIRHRPVFRAGPPGSPISPNLAGRDAAAFALCYQVFRRTHPALRRPLPARRRAHLRPRRHDAAGAC